MLIRINVSNVNRQQLVRIKKKKNKKIDPSNVKVKKIIIKQIK